jgi:RNAse (barnase) inhibitor barstar
MSNFAFEDHPALEPDDFLARVPPGLVGASALLHALSEQLDFPGYFGFNWDALSDCLRDLHWLSPSRVVLVHADMPSLPEAELRTYLKVLEQAVESWQPGEPYSLRVVFPDALRQPVTRLLAAPPSDVDV